MTEISKDGSIMGHRFEASGLGVAPFKFVCVTEKTYQACQGAPIQPGSSCDHCGNAIKYECWVQDSTGRKFKVGNSCIRHATGDSRLVTLAESEKRALINKKKWEAKQAIWAENRRLFEIKKAEEDAMEKIEIEALMPIYLDAISRLSAYPHPNRYFKSQGKTMADYLLYFENEQMPHLNGMKRIIDKANEF